MTLDIRGFIETSLLDWDGKLVSVIFLPFCNFRCGFCHNMGLNLDHEKFKKITEEHVIKYLEEHRDFIDGVCITGGEPTLHKEKELTQFIKKIKDMGLLIKLDTNGTDPVYLKELIDAKLLDFVAMDIKAPLGKYGSVTNVTTDEEAVKKSIELLMKSSVDYEFRTTVVPGLVDEKEIKEIAATLKGAKKYVIQQLVPGNCADVELTKLKPDPLEKLQAMAEKIKDSFDKVLVRGK